jgi:hypothetical protein
MEKNPKKSPDWAARMFRGGWRAGCAAGVGWPMLRPCDPGGPEGVAYGVLRALLDALKDKGLLQ